MGDTACLAMNDVGKPCAGEPHARFERGPLAKRIDRADKGEQAEAQHPTLDTNDQPAAYLRCESPFGGVLVARWVRGRSPPFGRSPMMGRVRRRRVRG